ncbi:MAG: hypothetical protein ACI8UD_000558 [Planctomycetota bacterium]|jgi:hypothetical protein
MEQFVIVMGSKVLPQVTATWENMPCRMARNWHDEPTLMAFSQASTNGGGSGETCQRTTRDLASPTRFLPELRSCVLMRPRIR